MLRIFIKDYYLLIAKEQSGITTSEKQITYEGPSSIKKAIRYITNEKNNCVLICKDVAKCFKDFSANYEIIEAAGGLVKNEENLYLFIFRNNKWDLPKGKIERKESIRSAAVREVKEECGLKKVKIESKLEPTYHVYREKGKNILKKTHWFSMITSEENTLIPQIEEGITHVEWMDKNQIKIALINSYPSIILLINSAIDLSNNE